MTRMFRFGLPLILVGATTLLSGCVVAPVGPYGYARPVVVAPAPVVVGGGWYWRRW